MTKKKIDYTEVTLSERYPFDRVSIDQAKLQRSGVYVFWFKKVCLYVGKTDRQLRDRLREHWTNCHNLDLKIWIKAKGRELEFQWACLSSDTEIRVAEQILIDTLNPSANKIEALKIK